MQFLELLIYAGKQQTLTNGYSNLKQRHFMFTNLLLERRQQSVVDIEVQSRLHQFISVIQRADDGPHTAYMREPCLLHGCVDVSQCLRLLYL